MDNDPKHYNELALGVFAANEIELLATKRSKADGTHPDVARGRGGHRTSTHSTQNKMSTSQQRAATSSSIGPSPCMA